MQSNAVVVQYRIVVSSIYGRVLQELSSLRLQVHVSSSSAEAYMVVFAPPVAHGHHTTAPHEPQRFQNTPLHIFRESIDGMQR